MSKKVFVFADYLLVRARPVMLISYLKFVEDAFRLYYLIMIEMDSLLAVVFFI